MRRLKRWPITELGAGAVVVGILLAWSCSAIGFLDAITGRLPADERLISAAATRDAKAFDAALADGASAKKRDPMGMTALGYAAIAGDSAAVARLLAAGAEVDAENRWGITPLMFAAEYDKSAVVKMLLRHGADPHRRGFNRQTAADRARSREADAAVKALANWTETRRAPSPIKLARLPLD